MTFSCSLIGIIYSPLIKILLSSLQEIFAAPRQAYQIPPPSNQPVPGPYPGNRATTSNMSNYSSANNHHRTENFVRSTPTSYQRTLPTRNYKNTYQPGRNNDLSTRGPRIGKGKGADQGEYNRKDFAVSYNKARFFMIKSYSENDVYNSMKYSVWSSTPHGNHKLDLVYRDAQKIEEVEGAKCPIFLFFSVSRKFSYSENDVYMQCFFCYHPVWWLQLVPLFHFPVPCGNKVLSLCWEVPSFKGQHAKFIS